MRYTRTQLARLFTNLAMAVMPDGIPGPYAHLVKASMELKDECDYQTAKEPKKDRDIRDLLMIIAGAQFAIAVAFIMMLANSSQPYETVVALLGILYALGTGCYFLKEGR